jgi:hypothetical protein
MPPYDYQANGMINFYGKDGVLHANGVPFHSAPTSAAPLPPGGR